MEHQSLAPFAEEIRDVWKRFPKIASSNPRKFLPLLAYLDLEHPEWETYKDHVRGNNLYGALLKFNGRKGKSYAQYAIFKESVYRYQLALWTQLNELGVRNGDKGVVNATIP